MDFLTNHAPRYLVPFHPKRMPHYFVDVLVIGGGLAGLRAALEVPSSLSVLVITKKEWLESNSSYAQGGIAGVMAPTDSFDEHIQDTLIAGGSLCNREIVDAVIRAGPERIEELMEWGTQFDTADGSLMLGREGGHGQNRILHAKGDATGAEIMRAVIERAHQAEHLQMWRDTFSLDLLVHEGCCRGALTWNPYHGKTLIWAKQTILCTGGTGQIYRETTNPKVATGDGHAMAYRAGVELRDMEFIQFHPTVLYIAGSSRNLITEAVRGEGAHLVDSTGHRFMPEYDERAELAPRDVVSQSIVTQMAKTHRPNVFLDLGHLDADFVHKRFPGISKVCAEFGIDIATDQIPVRPGAHYMIGGMTVDADGRTSMPGLWGAGEVTSSGLHGANRLASNSLLEGIVYGVRAGQRAAEAAEAIPDHLTALSLENRPTDQPNESLDIQDIRNALKSLLWRSAGVQRDGQSLEEAAGSVQLWCKYALVRQLTDPDGWELQNMLTVARLVIDSAVQRTESRGVHLRTDFPDQDDAEWRRHQTVCRTGS